MGSPVLTLGLYALDPAAGEVRFPRGSIRVEGRTEADGQRAAVALLGALGGIRRDGMPLTVHVLGGAVDIRAPSTEAGGDVARGFLAELRAGGLLRGDLEPHFAESGAGPRAASSPGPRSARVIPLARRARGEASPSAPPVPARVPIVADSPAPARADGPPCRPPPVLGLLGALIGERSARAARLDGVAGILRALALTPSSPRAEGYGSSQKTSPPPNVPPTSSTPQRQRPGGYV